MSSLGSNLVLGSLRERGTITGAAGLAGAYSGFMLVGAKALSAIAATSGGSATSIGKTLDIVAGVFIAIALYVSAIVIAGCVATVISGRSQQIATLRLLGADAKGLRRRVVREVGVTALLGSVIGAVIGMAIADVGRMYLVHRGTFPDADYPLVSGLVIPAVIAVVIVAALAGYTGSQRVLTVSPAAAMSGSTPQESRKASRVRAVFGVFLGLAGAGLLTLGCLMGEDGSSAALFVAFLGGAILVLGLITGAPFEIGRAHV